MKLILSGSVIISAVESVQDGGDRWITSDAHYPKWTVTDIVDGEIPAGFIAAHCQWINGQVVCEAPAVDLTEQFNALREERNRRLSVCDWTQLADAPLTTEQKAAWSAYRQALRDLPENTVDPANPVWPISPENE